LGLPPESRTQNGELMNPQRPIPADLALRDEQGQPYGLNQLKGQWLLISAGPGACPVSCVRGLFVLRNSHASQGKAVERLERVWFIIDDAPAAPVVGEARSEEHTSEL